jgi:dipeptidyl aminopeptidase/acylaminoacyl peptidase
VFVHGGPGGQTTSGYSAIVQYYVNHGYVVLGINNRGSSGYGKSFFAADDRKHGREPLWDCVDPKSHLASLPYVDANRIGIMGGSYGGYGARGGAVSAGRIRCRGRPLWRLEPAPYAGGDSGVVGGAAQGALCRDGRSGRRREDALRGVPGLSRDEDQEAALVLQGANDPRVIKAESDDIVAAVQKNGVPVDYVVFQDEGHGFTKKKNQIEGYSAVLKFLDTHLKGKAGTR